MDWIDAKKELPPVDQIVIVAYPSGYDGSPVYAWGARLDDGDGWCWGIKGGWGGLQPHKDAVFNDIEVDDEYPVSHWQPLPVPPFTAPAKS